MPKREPINLNDPHRMGRAAPLRSIGLAVGLVVSLLCVGCFTPHGLGTPADFVDDLQYEYGGEASAEGEYCPPTGFAAENPAHVGVADPEFLWGHLVDVIDDYFRIAHEERVRVVEDILTEGRIDSFPLTGATYLEPWRKDSVNSYERLESTYQSIRRTAHVRVMPAGGGFLVEVQVHKELEDLMRPEKSKSGFRLPDDDEDLVKRRKKKGPPGQVLGWISMGRDAALEQEILAKLRARIGQY